MKRPACLWLLRHAQPLIAQGVCYGRLDVPADPSQTLQAAMRFAAQMPQGRCCAIPHCKDVSSWRLHCKPQKPIWCVIRGCRKWILVSGKAWPGAILASRRSMPGRRICMG